MTAFLYVVFVNNSEHAINVYYKCNFNAFFSNRCRHATLVFYAISGALHLVQISTSKKKRIYPFDCYRYNYDVDSVLLIYFQVCGSQNLEATFDL